MMSNILTVIIMLLILGMLIIKIITGTSESQNARYSLYRVTAFNYYERISLYDMHLTSDNIIFLSGVTNTAALPMDIVVNECCTEEFEMDLQDKYIEYVNIDSDQIQDEFNNVKFLQENISAPMPNIKENFLDWNNLLLWVENSCNKYSTLKRITIGSTYEKRDMLLLKLSTGGKKPAVFVMGGEQGRDWMSTAIVLNFINNLLENPQDVLLKSFDFYIVPVFNPDGYEFSMKHDRFWNKNRKSFFPLKKCPFNKIAVGVNIDRNWFLEKSTTRPDGECESVYMGNQYLTEEETKALSTFLNSIATNLLAFINLRGFENLVTVPYADSNKYSHNQALLMEMLLYACEHMKRKFNVTYKFSDTASSFLNMSGNSADWVKYRLNVPIVYTMYLKQETFILPHTDHIIPLSNQFAFMTQEMLVLGNSIYEPLFNKQTSFDNNMTSATLFCLFISTWQQL